MTLKEALQVTNGILTNISVPVGLKEQIADPIALAVANINEVIKAIDLFEAPGDGEATAPEDNANAS